MSGNSKQNKEKKPQKDQSRSRPLSQPEDSVPLRLINYVLTIFCIVLGCYFVPTRAEYIVLYLTAASVGSYLSNEYRHGNGRWLNAVSLCGIALVIFAFVKELLDGMFAGAFDMRSAGIHLVIGTCATHSFELRGRPELSQTTFMAILLLCLVALSAKGITFGMSVFVFIALYAVLLYYQCCARAEKDGQEKAPIENAPVIASMSAARPRQRTSSGSAALVIACLPLLSCALFTLVPRGDVWINSFNAWASQQLQSAVSHAAESTNGKFQNNDLQTKDIYIPPIPAKGGRTVRFRDRRAQRSPHNIFGLGKNDKPKKQPDASANRQPNPSAAGGNPAQNGEATNGTGSSPGANATSLEQGAGARGGGSNSKGDDGESNEKVMSVNAPTKNLDMSRLLFRVAGNRTMYLRRFCYDTYNGVDWTKKAIKPEERFRKAGGDSFDIASAKALQGPKQLPSVMVEQQYAVESDDRWNTVCVGWVPQKLSIGSREIVVDRYAEVKIDHPLKKGARYKVNVQMPVYDLNSMRKDPPLDGERAKSIRQSLVDYLQLPVNHQAAVTALSQQVIGSNETSWFARAERISQYLRNNYQYTGANQAHGDNPVDDFLLKNRSGDCKSFASAFVIMCRCVGVPARLIGGYTPGDFNPFSGYWEVRVKHGHAWGEVYLPGYGWVPFDATPGGAMPAVSEEHSFAVIQNLVSANDKLALKTFLQSLQVQAPSILSALIAFVLAWQLIRKWRAWHQIQLHTHPATRLYNKMLKDLKRIKYVQNMADTPTEVAKRLESRCLEHAASGKQIDAALPATVDQFMQVYCQCYFGSKDEKLAELERLAAQIHEQLSSN